MTENGTESLHNAPYNSISNACTSETDIPVSCCKILFTVCRFIQILGNSYIVVHICTKSPHTEPPSILKGHVYL